VYSKEKEGDWVGYMLRRNWLLKQVIEGNLELRIEKKTGKKA
jgi:hypothetical protein